MNSILRTVALAVLALGAVARGQDAREIFDQRTLDGWDGDRAFWSVENGEIVGRETPEHQLSRSSWLIWRGGEVSDFRLDLDFRLIGGNSGVQFRSRDLGEFQVGGYQADLEDGPDWSGCLYEQEGRGVCARRGQSVRFDADGSKVVLDVADGAKLLEVVHAHEWNHYTIVARGSTMSFAINDVPMTTVTDLDPKHFAKSGILALQLHQGFAMEVHFKNLRLIDYSAPATPTAVAPIDRNTPQWIWTHADAKEHEHAYFRSRVSFSGGAPKSVRLSGSADNWCEVFVDGVSVLEHDDWTRPVFVDLTKELGEGEHELAIEAENDTGPAAVQFALDCQFADGASVRKVTHPEGWLSSPTAADGWKLADFDAVDWKPAASLGALGTGTWGHLPDPVALDAPRTLSPENVVVPPGFSATLVYSVPRRKQGSWVSMCFDDRQRILASDQYGPIYRLTLTGGAPHAEPLPIALGSAQGLCYADGALYVVCSERGPGYEPGLWRAKHRASDDSFEKPELLKKFEGGGEHGPHAVVLAPDGQSLYVVGGNHTRVPDGLAVSRVAQCWGEDQLLPQHSDPNGHAVGITAPGGWICKTDFDGREWELFACGFRNTYDMAFDDDGEAFTFDSDMEWDVGLPWYRPTMIEHVVPGGDYGWRTGSWRWPAYYEDSLTGAIDVGLASPTGMCNVPRSSPIAKALLRDGADSLVLAADWAYGRILAVELQPQGASYGCEFSKFISGKPLAVTDLLLGQDGALYFLVGGRTTQSAVYRVAVNDAAAPAPASAPSRATPDDLRARATRKDLERLQLEPQPAPLERAFAELDSTDRFVRSAARTLLEQQDPSLWIPRALAESRPWGAIECLIALARRGPKDLRDRALDRFAELPLEKMDDTRRLAALRALELVCIRLGEPVNGRRDALVARLDALFPNESNFANRELCQLLVFLRADDIVGKSLFLLDRAIQQEDQIAFAWALRSAKSPWTIEQREHLFHWLNETAAGWSGGLSFSKYLDDLRADLVASLSEAERKSLGDLVLKPQALEAASAAAPRAFVAHREVDSLLALADRWRRERNFERGKRVFKEVRCFECHRIANQGGGTGPDLTGAGNRFGDRDLLEAIIEPSKQISDQYQDQELVDADERLHVGRVERRADGSARLLPADGGAAEEFAASEIAAVRPHKVSRMPDGLLDTLSDEEVFDLIAYLRSGGNPSDGAFALTK